MKKRRNNSSILKETNSIYRNKLLLITVFAISTFLMLLPLFFKVQFREFASLGLLGVFIISFLGSATILLPAPALLAVGIGASLYNPFFVILVSTVGSALGESTTFLFGHSSKEIIGIKNHKIVFKFLRFLLLKYGIFIIPIFSFIPNPFFDGLGIVAGIIGFPIKKYLILTFIGRLLRNILIVFIGNHL